MAKSIHNDVLDAMLDYLKVNIDRIDFCSAEPTSYAEATSTYTLANNGSMTSGDFTGPADGDTNGRKLTVDALSGVSVTGNGTVTHLGYSDTGNTKLLMVNTTNSQGVSSGGTVDLAAHDAEVADPS